MSACLLAACLATLSAAPIDTLVVCPDPFRPALQPWLEHRLAQGHRVRVVSGGMSAERLRDEIRRERSDGALEYVVLVGDATSSASPPATPALTVPTWEVPSQVVQRFGSEATIASDNGYADLDGDALPDVAVGRLTADTPAELTAMVGKILAYERSADFGPWRRNVNLMAGLGGFGAVVDAAIETAARRIIVSGVPAAYTTHVTFGNWRSPYCPNPLDFRRAALESLSEGSLCWIYVGHASPHRLADLEVPGSRYASLSAADMAGLRSRHGAPIACLLACYTTAFDRSADCLAEEMLRSTGGPVAVVGGSRVTMPYAMAVLGCELMDRFFAARPETLGRAWVAAKRGMLATAADGSTRQAIDALAMLLSPADPRQELVEHLWLFNLLGDPLLRLRQPQELQLTGPAEAAEMATIEILATMPIAGEATVDLVPRRDRQPGPAPSRPRFVATPQMQAEYAETYRRANSPTLARARQNVMPGEVVLRLDVPAGVAGRCQCLVFVEGGQDCAAGAVDLEIVRGSPAANVPSAASDKGSAADRVEAAPADSSGAQK